MSDYRDRLKTLSQKTIFFALMQLGAAVRRMSRRQARHAASLIGDFMHSVLKIRRPLVYANLARTFPDKPPAAIARIARQVYRNTAVNLIEVLRLPLIKSFKDAAALVDIDARDFLGKTRDRNKGAVVVSAHYGNWELMAVAVGFLVTPVTVIVKMIHNQMVDRLMNEWRSIPGNRTIYDWQALREGLKILHAGGVLAILGDQSDPNAINFADFLGRKASIFHGAAFFALKANVPLFVVMCQRNRDGQRYTIRIHEIDTSDLTCCKQDIQTLALRYTKIIEEYIRQCPEEWFWLHDRWKRTPDLTHVSTQ